MQKLIRLSIFLVTGAQAIEPYDSVQLLPCQRHGWFNEVNQKYLEWFIIELKPEIIVELGTWLGLSTFFMARRLSPGRKLYAVDTWLGSKEHHEVPEWQLLLPTLYQQFLSNCMHEKLTQVIVPVRMTTLQAAEKLNIQPNLVYIDASHEQEDVFNDVMAWYKKLMPHGIICGDDWNWPSVSKGVACAAQLLHQTIYYEESFWWFDRKVLQ